MTPGVATAAGSTRISDNLGAEHSSAGPVRHEPDPPEVVDWKGQLAVVRARQETLRNREKLFTQLAPKTKLGQEDLKRRQEQIDEERNLLASLEKLYKDRIEHIYEMKRIDRIFDGTYEPDGK